MSTCACPLWRRSGVRPINLYFMSIQVSLKNLLIMPIIPSNLAAYSASPLDCLRGISEVSCPKPFSIPHSRHHPKTCFLPVFVIWVYGTTLYLVAYALPLSLWASVINSVRHNFWQMLNVKTDISMSFHFLVHPNILFALASILVLLQVFFPQSKWHQSVCVIPPHHLLISFTDFLLHLE